MINLKVHWPNASQVHLDKHVSATNISDHNKDFVSKDLQKQKVGINPSSDQLTPASVVIRKL